MTNSEVGSLYAGLSYEDAPAAIEWLCRVFGFTQRLVVPGPDGTVMHSELSLGGALIMLGTERAAEGRYSPRNLEGVNSGLSVYVADPDAHYAIAVAAGAEITQELEDTPFGARGYGARDLEGHWWFFSDYVPGANWQS
jgi:uncharacterized glyoxalase superfamily protein PhnB